MDVKPVESAGNSLSFSHFGKKTVMRKQQVVPPQKRPFGTFNQLWAFRQASKASSKLGILETHPNRAEPFEDEFKFLCNVKDVILRINPLCQKTPDVFSQIWKRNASKKIYDFDMIQQSRAGALMFRPIACLSIAANFLNL